MSLRQKVTDLRDRLELHGSYQRVFETPDGERVLNHILKVGFVTTSTAVAGDSHATSMNEGSRRLALSILRFLRKDHRKMIETIEKSIEENE